jgi:hypothetical protein
MGQAKDGGYMQKSTVTPEQKSFLDQILAQGGIGQQAMQGLSQFMPGGTGTDPIAAQARQGFERQTLPAIMEAMGTGAKGSSGLSQTLAGAGTDLEGQIAAMRSQMGLQATGMGLQSAMGAATEPQFAFMPRQMPFWQQATLGGLGGLGGIAGGLAGRR